MSFKYTLYTVATFAVIVLVLAIIQGWWALTNAKDLLLAMMSIIFIWALWVEVRLARLQLAAQQDTKWSRFFTPDAADCYQNSISMTAIRRQ